MKKLTEDNIIQKLHQGEESSFAYVYNLYKRRILFFVTQLLQDGDEAEDITSKVFLKVWDKRETFKTLENVKAFLYISAKNASYDYLKARKSFEERQKDISYQIETIEENAEHWKHTTELIVELYKEVDNLPKKAKEIVKLYFFEGMSSRQIAEKLYISQVTVMNAKGIALKKLKAVFIKKKLLSM